MPWIATQNALITVYFYDPAAPPLLAAVLTVPVIAAVMTVAAAVFAIISWKEHYWTVAERVHYTIVTAALIALLWWTNAWNLWVFCL